MGYTHYWSFEPCQGNTAKVEAAYQRALLDCSKVVYRYAKEHGGIMGYTAHVKPGTYNGVFFNGSKDEGHEDYMLREHFKQNDSFNFCKTAQKPYDILVVACLAILKHRLKEYISVSSDGDASDWSEGVALARQITKLKIKNPIAERQVEQVLARVS